MSEVPQRYLPGIRIRKLTPKECWRLMGFDDDDCDKASKVCSNTQLYKQAGNSIVVAVLEAILENLLKVDVLSDDVPSDDDLPNQISIFEM